MKLHALNFVWVCLVTIGSTADADDRELFVRELGARALASAGALVPSPTGEGTDDGAAQAIEALARAEAQFLSYSFADAAAGLVFTAQRVNGSLIASRRDLVVRMDLWVGASSLLANEPAEARAAFRRALALDPEVVLPAGVFPPEVQSVFEASQRAWRAAAPAGRTLTTLPAGARVSLDGRPVGISPVSVSLTPGTHYLSVERVGYHRFRDRVSVEGEGLVAPWVVVLERASVLELREQASRPEGLPEAPDGVTLGAMARAFGLRRALYAGRDGSFVRVPDPGVLPSRGPGAWPWVLGASVGTASLLGVLIYGAVSLSQESGVEAPRLTLVLGF